MAERRSSNGGEVVINVSDTAASASTDSGRKLPSPNNEGLARRKSFSRSVYSKPNSRFGKQQSYRFNETIVEEDDGTSRQHSFSRTSFNKSNMSVGAAALNKVDEEETDEHEEIYEKVKLNRVKRSGIKPLALLELAVFVAILCTLVVSLTVEKVNKHLIWGLEVWKWCVFVMVTLCGMLIGFRRLTSGREGIRSSILRRVTWREK